MGKKKNEVKITFHATKGDVDLYNISFGINTNIS